MNKPLLEIGGSENLEVMAEARYYNAFLLSQVIRAMAGRRRILDFGAGSGTFAFALKARGYSVACVEPEPALANTLARGGLETHQSLDRIPERSIEGVYTLNVLEHIEDDEAVLRGLYRKLVRGGRIFIYVPAFQVLYSSMDRRVGHVRRYALGDLVTKCRRAGFAVERARYCDSLGFAATLAYRVAGRRDGSLERRTVIAYDRWVYPVSLALDLATGRLFGKNVWVVASRP